jgi:hypothetical protein
MKKVLALGAWSLVAFQLGICGRIGAEENDHPSGKERSGPSCSSVPGHFYLLERMAESPLKKKLESAPTNGEIYTPRLFSIGIAALP